MTLKQPRSGETWLHSNVSLWAVRSIMGGVELRLRVAARDSSGAWSLRNAPSSTRCSWCVPKTPHTRQNSTHSTGLRSRSGLLIGRSRQENSWKVHELRRSTDKCRRSNCDFRRSERRSSLREDDSSCTETDSCRSDGKFSDWNRDPSN